MVGGRAGRTVGSEFVKKGALDSNVLKIKSGPGPTPPANPSEAAAVAAPVAFVAPQTSEEAALPLQLLVFHLLRQRSALAASTAIPRPGQQSYGCEVPLA